MILSLSHYGSPEVLTAIGVPATGPFTGKTQDPPISVWPFGQGSNKPLLQLTPDEAEELARKLVDAAREARELFPGG